MPPASSISEIPQRRTSDRVARIAAVGDIHCGEEDRGAFRDQLARANDDADILILCGDLTRRGSRVLWRLMREGGSVQEQYRARLPELTSRDTWSKLFESE